MNKFFCVAPAITFLMSIPSIQAIDGAGPYLPEQRRPSFQFKVDDPSRRNSGDEKAERPAKVTSFDVWDGTEDDPKLMGPHANVVLFTDEEQAIERQACQRREAYQQGRDEAMKRKKDKENQLRAHL